MTFVCIATRITVQLTRSNTFLPRGWWPESPPRPRASYSVITVFLCRGAPPRLLPKGNHGDHACPAVQPMNRDGRACSHTPAKLVRSTRRENRGDRRLATRAFFVHRASLGRSVKQSGSFSRDLSRTSMHISRILMNATGQTKSAHGAARTMLQIAARVERETRIFEADNIRRFDIPS